MAKVIEIFFKCGSFLFFAFLLISVLPLLLYNTELNAPFFLAFKYLTIPIFAVCFSLGLIWKKEFIKHADKPRNYWLCLFLVPPILLLMSGGLVVGLNAILPGQEIKTVEGTITKHEQSSGKYKSNLIEITNAEGKLTMIVSGDEFSRLKIGDKYSKEVNYGSFGFPYTKK